MFCHLPNIGPFISYNNIRIKIAPSHPISPEYPMEYCDIREWMFCSSVLFIGIQNIILIPYHLRISCANYIAKCWVDWAWGNNWNRSPAAWLGQLVEYQVYLSTVSGVFACTTAIRRQEDTASKCGRSTSDRAEQDCRTLREIVSSTVSATTVSLYVPPLHITTGGRWQYQTAVVQCQSCAFFGRYLLHSRVRTTHITP